VKMKYPDDWQQRVMNAPVKYFEPYMQMPGKQKL